jgi:dihydrofolate synthase/folylpolyglutamate synthase
MNYKQTIEYINELSRTGIVLGLDNMRRMCSALGEPQLKVKAIHIAGTNGKGSIGAMIASVIASSALKCGHYSSPAVISYLDKWSINGKLITEDELAEVATKLRTVAEEIECTPTVFEFETLIAFEWFKQKDCDFSVIECGMGGRLDATNVIDNKVMAVIAPVDIDHSAFLGSSIAEIAAEKSGIITDDCAVISAEQCDEAKAVLLQRRSDIIFADSLAISNVNLEPESTSFDYKDYKGLNLRLLGRFQCDNATVAIEACEELSRLYPDIKLKLKDGLKAASWRCRFELLSEEPLIIIDAAHNPHGARALKENIELYLDGKSVALIMGVFADKDYATEARLVAPLASMIYTVTAEGERALSAVKLANTVAKYNENVKAELSVEHAIDEALASGYDAVVIFGSLSFLGEAYLRLRGDYVD